MNIWPFRRKPAPRVGIPDAEHWWDREDTQQAAIPMTPESIDTATNGKFGQIFAMQRPAISFRHATPEKLRSGLTKLGGRPNLLQETPWPEHDGIPLPFVCQIDLLAISGLPGSEHFPDSGLMLVFYDLEEGGAGYDIKDRDSWRVIVQPRIAGERELPLAIPKGSVYREVPLCAKSELMFPDSETLEHYPLLTPDELDAYQNLWIDSQLGENKHQLLGYPKTFLDDMMADLHLLHSSGTQESRVANSEEIAAGAREWRILMQIDSDDDANMMWSDCGTLFFWIHDEDFRLGRFDRAWMMRQSC
jgi:uncharacterized protein YwqG